MKLQYISCICEGKYNLPKTFIGLLKWYYPLENITEVRHVPWFKGYSKNSLLLMFALRPDSENYKKINIYYR